MQSGTTYLMVGSSATKSATLPGFSGEIVGGAGDGGLEILTRIKTKACSRADELSCKVNGHLSQ